MRKLFISAVVAILLFGVVYAANLGFKGQNVLTDFNRDIDTPDVSDLAHIHPQATLIGDATIGDRVFVAPHAFVRGDEGQPIHVGDESNIQDGAGIHALETESNAHGSWEFLDGRRFSAAGERLGPEVSGGYSVYISDRVSLAHQSLVHGPAWIGHDTFLGMQSQVFNAKVGNEVAVGVRALITGGVSIPDGRYVPPGSVITTQAQADALPSRIGSPYENTNEAVVHVNTSLADGYNDLADE